MTERSVLLESAVRTALYSEMGRTGLTGDEVDRIVVKAIDNPSAQRLLAAQPGRSASDGVGDVMSHELEKALAGIEQNIETMLATSYHRRQAERIRDLVRLAIPLHAALATPPPAPDGERVEAGSLGNDANTSDPDENLFARVRDELAWATRTLHRLGITSQPRHEELAALVGMTPLPPTPAAAVSVSALVEALRDWHAEWHDHRTPLEGCDHQRCVRIAQAVVAARDIERRPFPTPEQVRSEHERWAADFEARHRSARDTGARGEGVE